MSSWSCWRMLWRATAWPRPNPAPAPTPVALASAALVAEDSCTFARPFTWHANSRTNGLAAS
eukprot:8846848-Alexandrium_andersonii.AAC.1